MLKHKYKPVPRCCKAKLAHVPGDMRMWTQGRNAPQEQTAAQRWWEVLAKPNEFPLSLRKSDQLMDVQVTRHGAITVCIGPCSITGQL